MQVFSQIEGVDKAASSLSYWLDHCRHAAVLCTLMQRDIKLHRGIPWLIVSQKALVLIGETVVRGNGNGSEPRYIDQMKRWWLLDKSFLVVMVIRYVCCSRW